MSNRTDLAMWQDAIKDGTIDNGRRIHEVFEAVDANGWVDITKKKGQNVNLIFFIISIIAFAYIQLNVMEHFANNLIFWHFLVYLVMVNAVVAVNRRCAEKLGKKYVNIVRLIVLIVYVGFIVTTVRYDGGTVSFDPDFIKGLFTFDYLFNVEGLLIYFVPYAVGAWIGKKK